MRILLVDDDETITTSLSILLQSEGYNIDVAHTGKEAIEKSNENIYDLMILDIKLLTLKAHFSSHYCRKTPRKLSK